MAEGQKKSHHSHRGRAAGQGRSQHNSVSTPRSGPRLAKVYFDFATHVEESRRTYFYFDSNGRCSWQPPSACGPDGSSLVWRWELHGDVRCVTGPRMVKAPPCCVPSGHGAEHRTSRQRLLDYRVLHEAMRNRLIEANARYCLCKVYQWYPQG